jgi:hypothetical protein
MIISQTQSEISAALKLVSKSELKRVRLRKCHVSLEGTDERLKGPFSLAQSHNSTASTIVANILRIEVRFTFQSLAIEEKTSLFSVECYFDLDYALEEGYEPSPESIEAFSDGNAIFNCWPYAREFVQSMTSRMELNPPPLPLLRIVPKKPAPKAPASTPLTEPVSEPGTADPSR